MKNFKHFYEFLRLQIHSYRSRHSFTQERMAEILHISARSYFDQEHGKYGFSSPTFAFFLLNLSEEEVLRLLKDARTVLEGRNENDIR